MPRPATGLARAGEPALIPGRSGRPRYRTSGAYGVELASVCAYVEAFNWQSGEVERIAAADCRFGYRDSIFCHYQDSHFITAVGLRLPKACRSRRAMVHWRRSGMPRRRPFSTPSVPPAWPKLPDPAVLGNVGSFFKTLWCRPRWLRP